MLRFLSDENFNGDIVRGLLRRCSDLDLVRIQDVGLDGASDPDILDWAGKNNRILLTHDRATIPNFAYDRVKTGESMPGVFVINDHFPIKQAINELFLINTCTEQEEWNGLVVYLPL